MKVKVHAVGVKAMRETGGLTQRPNDNRSSRAEFMEPVGQGQDLSPFSNATF